jgi:NADH dehydrogenase FAD-containing subunit
MSRKLLLAGGGHAHMMVLASLERFIAKGHQVTVVQPSPYHYYSGMGPGMLGKTYSPEGIRFATRQVVEKQGGTFVLDRVQRIDPAASTAYLESGAAVPYDVLSFNVGSYVPQNMVAADRDRIFTVKPIERLYAARQLILDLAAQKPLTIGVIGGGPSAVEIAGNVWGLTRDSNLHPVTIRIFTRSTVMGEFPEGVRSRAVRSLRSRKIEIIEECEVREIQPGRVVLGTGSSHELDVIFVAVGVRPSPVFADSGLSTGPDGGLVVNRYLQSIDYPNIFGGGDCIHFRDRPLDKVGVYAVRENPVLLHNLSAAMDGGSLKEFEPGGDYLLIFNLGDGTGIFRKKFLLFNGRAAFLIKDYIDRRFMKKFQAIE